MKIVQFLVTERCTQEYFLNVCLLKHKIQTTGNVGPVSINVIFPLTTGVKILLQTVFLRELDIVCL